MQDSEFKNIFVLIIVDIQGGNAICRHSKFYERNNKLIMQDIMDYIKQDDIQSLKALYPPAPHWNAWIDVNYGGDPEGIFSAACLLKALHALENGIFIYLL